MPREQLLSRWTGRSRNGGAGAMREAGSDWLIGGTRLLPTGLRVFVLDFRRNFSR